MKCFDDTDNMTIIKSLARLGGDVVMHQGEILLLINGR